MWPFFMPKILKSMYKPTGKRYFSGAGGMEIGLMQAGADMIQSLDLDPETTACMEANPHYSVTR